MRVLHVIPSIDASYGGPSYALKAIVAYQNKAGICADIATTHHSHGSRQEFQVDSCEGGGSRIFSFQSFWGEYKFSLALWRWLSSNVKNYDIVHIHSVFCFSTAIAAKAARAADVPYIVRPLGQLYAWALKNRSRLIKRCYLILIENRTLKHAAAFHFTAEDERNQCGIALDKSKGYVLPLGIEVQQKMLKSQALTFYPQLKNKKVLLFLSRIHPKKGLDLTLPWLAELLLRRPDWVFVIAGGAERVEYLESLKKLIKRYGIEQQVVFSGHVSGEKKRALHHVADLFFLPSHSENFGIAVVEAMAAGVPVLVSDQVGIQGLIAHARAGLVFCLDHSSFGSNAAQLMDNQPLREEMSGNAGRLVREKFNWQFITDKQIEKYRQLCAGTVQ